MHPDSLPAADDDVMLRPAEGPDAVLRYAAHDDGLVDVHLPAGGGGPLVVFVHGGFWRQAYDRRHARPLAHALTALGCVVALPEYRRGPGAWPATAQDLPTVVAGLPAMLEGIAVPTTRTVLCGHSAGGQLVLWLANEPQVARGLDRVVALAPVGNLRRAVEHEMGAGAAVDFLGGTPEEIPEVYDAADPATRMRTRPDVEVVVVHGDRDEDVPVQSSRGLSNRFDWLDYRELPGAGHLDLVDPRSAAWPHVAAALRRGVSPSRTSSARRGGDDPSRASETLEP